MKSPQHSLHKQLRAFFPYFCLVALLHAVPVTGYAQSGEATILKPPSGSSINTRIRIKSIMRREDFISSRAADFFRTGQYKEALVELLIMKLQYPSDITIRRYIGIAHFKLGNYPKAVKAFLNALTLNPDNLATQFYLAEAYAFQNEFEKARVEYTNVLEAEPGGRYASAASKRMEQLRKPVPKISDLALDAAGKPKPWSLSMSVGYEFDNNATFNPSDADFHSLSDQNAGRYSFGIDGSYDLVNREKWGLVADYGYNLSLYDDSLNDLNTFTQSAGIAVTRVFDINDKPLVLRFRESMTHTLLKDKFFVFANSLTTIAFYRPAKNILTVAIYDFSLVQFDDNTEEPSTFGRDGYSHSVILLNTLYFNDDQNFYVTLGYDYQHDDTSGRNFIRDVHGGRLLLHSPIPFLSKVEGEIGVEYHHDERPNYKADTADGPRRDDLWDLSLRLTRLLGENMSLELFYTYQRTFSKNNAFEYRRSFGGSSLTLNF